MLETEGARKITACHDKETSEPRACKFLNSETDKRARASSIDQGGIEVDVCHDRISLLRDSGMRHYLNKRNKLVHHLRITSW